MHALPAAVGDAALRVTLSVDADATRAFLLKSAAYACVFALALLLVDDRKRLRQLAVIFVFSGVLQAFYGSLSMLSGVEIDFFNEKLPPGGVARGTFANRNHFAGYLEMTVAIGIGLLMASLGGDAAYTWRQRLRNLIKLLLSPKMRLRVYLAVMVVALVLSRSRMGNTAFFSSLVIAGVIGLMLSRHATRSTIILLASLIVIDLFIVGAWFGVEQVAQRLQETSLEAETRDEVDEYGRELVRDYVSTGSGGGSFYAVFPRYRTGELEKFNNHAHNDYLEFASDTGIVGISILGSIVVLSLGAALIAQYRRRDPLLRGMGFAGVMGITALLIHSTVDFNLQIPANAMTFMIVLALCWLALYLEARPGASLAPAPSRSLGLDAESATVTEPIAPAPATGKSHRCDG
jgi:O-antigen ligase